MIPVHVAAAKNIKNAVVNNKDSNVIFKRITKNKSSFLGAFVLKLKFIVTILFFRS